MVSNNNSGYILPSVLLISLLVTSLLMGILSIIFFYNAENQKLIKKTELDLACYSALQTFISENQDATKEEIFIKIDSIKVRLRNKIKGIYTEVQTTAYNKKDSSKIYYLLGNQIENQFQNAVIISKDKLRASIAGDTKINGDMLLTSDKVKIGRISGIKSANKNYLNGEIITQEEIQVKLFNELLISNQFNNDFLRNNPQYVDGDFELNNATTSEIIENISTQISGDLVVSGEVIEKKLGNTSNLLVSGEVVFNEGTYSSSDMKVVSDSSITIEENCIIENTILVAESKIIIEGNTHFKNVQLFSKKGIEISGANFRYPSIIAVYSNLDLESNLENKIKIESSIVNGSILCINSTTGLSNNKNLIEIDEDSKVQGLIYSENNSKIAGEVNGIIYTHSFWYYKEPTEYINWLVDVKVDREKLDEAFLLPVGFSEVNNFRILKETWIN